MTSLPTLSLPPDYHWSPTNQRAFLEHLAIVGSVTLAAKHVGMSTRAAYDLKLRRDGAAFKLGWAAAVLIARERLGDDLLERAIHGYEEEYVRTPPDENGEVRIRRHRIDSRLGMEYLKRLDRMADGVAENAGELQLAQIIMGDWEAFLDRLAPVEGEGGVAAVACWLAGRDNRFNPLSGLWEKPDEDCEVTQISAVSAQDIEADLPPEEEAACMSVWYCSISDGYRTDFPPPTDFDGDEDGQFGDRGYERTLSDEEERIQMAMNATANAPLRKAGINAREAWFSDEGADIAKAEIAEESAAREERVREYEATEQERRRMPDDAEAAICLPPLETKSEAEPLPPPTPDPTIRVIHCEPPFNYAAHGMIPPWAERIY